MADNMIQMLMNQGTLPLATHIKYSVFVATMQFSLVSLIFVLDFDAFGGPINLKYIYIWLCVFFTKRGGNKKR